MTAIHCCVWNQESENRKVDRDLIVTGFEIVKMSSMYLTHRILSCPPTSKGLVENIILPLRPSFFDKIKSLNFGVGLVGVAVVLIVGISTIKEEKELEIRN